MKHFVLTTATVALMAGASPLWAQTVTQDELSTMRCADFRALDSAQQIEVAALAVAEQEGGGESLHEGDAKADEPASEEPATTEAEADAAQDTTIVDNEGTATATEGGPDVEEETAMEADMEALLAACDRNLDAMVLEAAAGMDTQR